MTTQSEVRPPYIYGQVLARSLYEDERPRVRKPGFVLCLFQAATVGVLVAFVLVLLAMIKNTTYYFYLFMAYLPKGLLYGLSMGVFEGLLIWICIRLTHGPLEVLARIVVPVPVLLLFFRIAAWVLGERADGPPDYSNLQLIKTIAVPALLFGLITGSKLNLSRLFLDGLGPKHEPIWFASRMTGLILRLFIVFITMEVVMVLTTSLRLNEAINIELVALGVALLALAVVFTTFRFELRAVFSFVINSPVVYLLLKQEDTFSIYIFCGYFILWSLFLLSHSRIVYSAYKVACAEVRYYLID